MEREEVQDARDLLIHFRRFRLNLMAWVNRRLARAGTNVPQYTVMAMLDEMGEATMGALASYNLFQTIILIETLV